MKARSVLRTVDLFLVMSKISLFYLHDHFLNTHLVLRLQLEAQIVDIIDDD